MAAELEKYDSWCFDTETTGLNPLMDNLLGVAFCAEPHKAWYMPVSGPADLEAVRPLLEGPAEKIGHHLKFDLIQNSRLSLKVWYAVMISKEFLLVLLLLGY